MKSVEDAGFKPGKDIYLSLDVASTEFYKNNKYDLKGEKIILSSDEMIQLLREANIPLYVEDVRDYLRLSLLFKEINPQVVFYIVLYRLPEFLELILPLSFFMSVVLTIGKFSSESELTIMEQLGLSNARIYSLLAIPAVLIALLIFFFSLVLSPGLDMRVKSLLEVKSLEETFDALLPGEFHKLNDSYLIYAKEKRNDGLKDVFLLMEDSTRESSLAIVAEELSANRSGNGDLNFGKGFSYSKEEPDEIFSVKFDNLK